MNDILLAGMIAAVVGVVVFPVLLVASLIEARKVFNRWWFLLTWVRHLADVEREAWEIHDTRDDVETLYRKVHYRHNIHCPSCGRFARRVPDLPDGVSDCLVHGIRMRTVEWTGMVDVEIRLITLHTVMPEPPAVTNAYELPEIVIDYTDDDFVADADGLPVYTQPLAIEEGHL